MHVAFQRNRPLLVNACFQWDGLALCLLSGSASACVPAGIAGLTSNCNGRSFCTSSALECILLIPTVKKNANTKKAYEYIRGRILGGTYAPGYRLQTVDLAAEIGVSRTPVRDALRKLESERLVTISPRLGASVRSLNAAEFRELCELRLALESAAAELAARNRGPEDLLELEDALETMDAAVKRMEKDPVSKEAASVLIHQDLRFHFGVIKAARNNLVRDEIERLHLLNRVIWMSVLKVIDGNPDADMDANERRVAIQDHHRRIFVAIKGQKPDAARKAMHEHITDIIDRRIRAMARAEKKRDMRSMSHENAPYAYDSVPLV